MWVDFHFLLYKQYHIFLYVYHSLISSKSKYMYMSFQCFIMRNFKYVAQLKEFYSKHLIPATYILPSGSSIHLVSFYPVHLTIHLHIFDAFQSKLKPISSLPLGI